jgi:hypothetical protein
MKIKLFVMAGMLATVTIQAQTIEELRITEDYRGRLDAILERIGKEHHLRFVYDTAHVSRYTTSVNPEQEKTIGGMLRMFRCAWDMETTVYVVEN